MKEDIKCKLDEWYSKILDSGYIDNFKITNLGIYFDEIYDYMDRIEEIEKYIGGE